VPLAADVDLQMLARSTPGMSGADLKNFVNEAALQAAKSDKDTVDSSDFSEAYDKIVMGNERGSVRLSPEERHIVAIHESGHAMIAVLSPSADPLHKVSIIPRGHSLGVTQQLPVDERHNYPMEYLVTRLRVLLGGRAAEVVASNSLTNGAENDLILATKLARKMVTSWGMSERIGNIAVEGRTGSIFLGEQLAQVREYSERTAWEIDVEIKRIVDEAFNEARAMLEENRHTLFALAEVLEEKEVMEGKEIIQIVKSQEKVLEPVQA